MSPFGGDGANLAMQDGADLALALAAGGDWMGAVRDYEVAICARAEPAAAAAWESITTAFSEDGLAHLLQTAEAHRVR